MKKTTVKMLFFGFGLSLLGNFLFAAAAQAAFELVKSTDFDTIYYIDSRGERHAFPNEITYRSWYGKNFSKVITVSNELLADYPLGKNITIRPGTFLVKTRTTPEVYAVEQGGVLRELQSETVAEGIYGPDWAGRVIDLPEVFLENYLIGEPIVHDYTIADSVLYLDEASGKYYYKNNGILREFITTAAALENYFDLSFAILSGRSYFVRSRPITGFDKNVFNPAAEPLFDRRDCESADLKAAMIFLADKNYTPEEIARLQTIKKEIPERFAWATDNFSKIDVSYPTSVILDDGYLLRKRDDGTTEIENETINTFYDNNPDIFDFIFVFTNFTLPTEQNSNEVAHFVPVSNKLEGINKANLDRSEVYGSAGKLKGIIVMGDINKYKAVAGSGLNETLNVIMHEILHQWSAYIKFIDENGEESAALLREKDEQHWSIYAGFISPLGGSGWIDNGDGTFTSGLTQISDTNLRPYSRLDLYLMGLIPEQLMEPVTYLAPEKPDELGNTIKAKVKQVSIDQIIKASGKIKCSFD